jgi:hypothetical protein
MFTKKLKLYLEREVIRVEKEMHGLSRSYHTQNKSKIIYKSINVIFLYMVFGV